MTDIVNKQRDQLFGELIRTVVITAICDHSGQTVGVVESPHEVVGRGLRSRIWAVGLVFEVFGEELLTVRQMMLTRAGLGGEGRLNAFWMRHLQGAINLIGGDVIEAFALVFFRKVLPVEFRSLQQAKRAHHVGLSKCKRILDGTIDMGLGGEVDDAVDLFVLHQFVDAVEVADVHLDELVVLLVLDVLQVGEIAGIGQLVQVNYLVLWIFVYEEADDVAADETGSAGDDNAMHDV